MSDDRIALFELTTDSNDDVLVIDEKHYLLVPSGEITAADLAVYSRDSH